MREKLTTHSTVKKKQAQKKLHDHPIFSLWFLALFTQLASFLPSYFHFRFVQTYLFPPRSRLLFISLFLWAGKYDLSCNCSEISCIQLSKGNVILDSCCALLGHKWNKSYEILQQWIGLRFLNTYLVWISLVGCFFVWLRYSACRHMLEFDIQYLLIALFCLPQYPLSSACQ